MTAAVAFFDVDGTLAPGTSSGVYLRALAAAPDRQAEEQPQGLANAGPGDSAPTLTASRCGRKLLSGRLGDVLPGEWVVDVDLRLPTNP